MKATKIKKIGYFWRSQRNNTLFEFRWKEIRGNALLVSCALIFYFFEILRCLVALLPCRFA
jgi:hypothetical protein